MNIQYIGKDFEFNEKIIKTADEKLHKYLDRLLSGFDEAAIFAKLYVEKHSRWGFVVKMEMSLPGKKKVFAKVHNSDLTKSFTELREELEKQIKKHKDKLTR
jgi:ribosomal subunit interface protein